MVVGLLILRSCDRLGGSHRQGIVQPIQVPTPPRGDSCSVGDGGVGGAGGGGCQGRGGGGSSAC